MQIAATARALFILNAVLWYVRPTAGLWLLGLVVLGVIWGAIFLRLIATETARHAE